MVFEGTRRDCTKSTRNKLWYWCIYKCAITVLHEQWMQRHIPITLCNLVTFWSLYPSLFYETPKHRIVSRSNTCIILYTNIHYKGTDIRITVAHSVMEACLCIHCSCCAVMAHFHIVMFTSIRACFLYNLHMSPLNSMIFFLIHNNSQLQPQVNWWRTQALSIQSLAGLGVHDMMWYIIYI